MHAMMTTYERGLQEGLERGLQEGLERGRLQGCRQALLPLLEKKFGPLSPAARQRWESWSREQIFAAVLAVLDTSSLRELGLED
jgi:hypothetical protein